MNDKIHITNRVAKIKNWKGNTVAFNTKDIFTMDEINDPTVGRLVTNVTVVRNGIERTFTLDAPLDTIYEMLYGEAETLVAEIP